MYKKKCHGAQWLLLVFALASCIYLSPIDASIAGSGAGAGAGEPARPAKIVASPTLEQLNTLLGFADFVFKAVPERKCDTTKEPDEREKNLIRTFFCGTEDEPVLIPLEEIKRVFKAYFAECFGPRGLGSDEAWFTKPKQSHTDSSAPDIFSDKIHEMLKDSSDPSTALPFVQQRDMAKGDQVVMMGDLHGSLHSLLRNLLHLAENNLLNNDLTLAPNVSLVILGDMTDRGVYGIEIVYFLLQLKLKNWDNVYILRGNHESFGCTYRYGFHLELEKKYGATEVRGSTQTLPDDGCLYKDYMVLCGSLPLALFLRNQGKVIQCCHGGIEPCYSPNDFFQSSLPYDYVTRNIPRIVVNGKYDFPGQGFQWSDVKGKSPSCRSSEDNTIFNVGSRNRGFDANIQDIENYCDACSTHDWQLVKIVRGHQDNFYCFKLTDPVFDDPVNWCNTHYYWASYGMMNPEQMKLGESPDFAEMTRKNRLQAENVGIYFSEIPCHALTMSSAVEGQGNMNEGYGILLVDGDFNNWRYQVYQNPMNEYCQDVFVARNIRGYVRANCLNYDFYDTKPSHNYYPLRSDKHVGVAARLRAKILRKSDDEIRHDEILESLKFAGDNKEERAKILHHNPEWAAKDAMAIDAYKEVKENLDSSLQAGSSRDISFLLSSKGLDVVKAWEWAMDNGFEDRNIANYIEYSGYDGWLPIKIIFNREIQKLSTAGASQVGEKK